MRRYDAMSVLVHGTTVAGPLAARNLSLAKGLAAEHARAVLSDPISPHHLSCVCLCPKKGAPQQPREELPLDIPDKKELSDETNEGFDLLARILLEETEEAPTSAAELQGEHDAINVSVDEDLAEEAEVEQMMGLDQ